jgi:tetratricopeptide (TPR) repeat protein
VKQIKAFVGHSFTEDDAEVVGKFSKYFDQLAKSRAGFSWEHAEEAESKVLTEKVMKIISDKNVFIGICTKKERVTSTKLQPQFFNKRMLHAEESAFSWKTSDWIIQEIGLAIGKGLELILLVENGVRKPGGLQGDIEYIPFDRTYPEKSFGKLLEMITALTPRVTSLSGASSESGEASSKEKVEQPNTDFLVPKPEWKRQNYEFAFLHAVADENDADKEAINSAYLSSFDAGKEDNKQSWEAFVEYTSMWLGKGGSLSQLKVLAEAHPESSGTLYYLAKAFEEKELHIEAAQTYEVAAQKATKKSDTLRLSGLAAIQQAQAKKPVTTKAIIDKMRDYVAQESSGELQLLNTLKSLSEITKETSVQLGSMERMVEIDPDDSDTLFSLAYKYSEAGHHDLALLNYLRIPFSDRNEVTWNNLGVAFQEFKLVSKAVEHYRKAAEMGSTLAMSNLAGKFLSEGFLDEAKLLSDKALQTSDYHQNIVHNLVRIKELPDEEKEKQDELIEKARPKSEFYKKYGRALARIERRSITGHWVGPDCELTVTLEGSALKVVGSYERTGYGALASALGVPDTPRRFDVLYKGTLRGQAIEAQVKRTQQGVNSPPPSLLSIPDEPAALMVISDDGSQIEVMESTQGRDVRFYSLKSKAV